MFSPPDKLSMVLEGWDAGFYVLKEEGKIIKYREKHLELERKNHLEYRNAHYSTVFHVITKSVEECIDMNGW